MLIGQRLHVGFAIDGLGHRHPVYFYLDDVLNASKTVDDDGKARFHAKLRGITGRGSISVEIDSRTMRFIPLSKVAP